MWMVLAVIGLLTALSVLGAFCGAQKAKLIFNSIPLGVYWYGLAVLLVAGMVEFPRLLHKPRLFMIHAGCLLVLAGSMWGSEAGHRLGERLFGIRKIPNGYMLISEGNSEKHVMTEDFRQRLGELPFSIKLKDFRLEYYETDEELVPRLLIRDYFSDVVVIKDGKEVTSKTIEVNHPLHYGGYHFYQHSYDSQAGKYTILSVTSDSGLYAVYGGYWLLCLGVLWQFWFRHIIGYIKSRKPEMRYGCNGD